MHVKRFTPTATMPVRGSPAAAGFDISAHDTESIPPQESRIIKTGFQIAIPWGTYARIAPRSGLAVKH